MSNSRVSGTLIMIPKGLGVRTRWTSAQRILPDVKSIDMK